MAQSSQAFCPQCGTPVPPGQRFCSNCGASTDPGFSKPTAMASGEYVPQIPQQPTQYSAPPPPPASSYSQPAQPTPAPPTYYAPQQGQGFPPQQGQNFAPQQSYQPAPVPDYAKPQKDSSRSVLGQMGCGILIVILIIVGICGGASFFAYRFLTSAASSASTST
ncbi:MAG TPA: zinc ribbon domain-containing protein, partial [Ktedonobacteraceae bacterium]|nr:zinc ribbon domain-containing protein [Ktedonobacteraceae bacterium]